MMRVDPKRIEMQYSPLTEASSKEVLVCKGGEALENVIEDEPYFITKIIDDHLQVEMAMVKGRFHNLRKRWWLICQTLDIIEQGFVEVAGWWSEVVDLRVEMVPEEEKSMVVELFLECSIDNLGGAIREVSGDSIRVEGGAD
nr:hypothetical protein [Tanacetum cinerariifolium]